MNTLLEALFDKHNLSEKDRYDIRQTFSFLPLEKQKNLLNNFDVLAARLKKIEEELQTEQSILLGDLYQKIDKAIETERRRRLVMDR